MTAPRAHQPYRNHKVSIIAPKVTLTTRIVSKIIKLKFKILRILKIWKRPIANRTQAARRIVRRNTFQAKNKADPHLEKRV